MKISADSLKFLWKSEIVLHPKYILLVLKVQSFRWREANIFIRLFCDTAGKSEDILFLEHDTSLNTTRYISDQKEIENKLLPPTRSVPTYISRTIYQGFQALQEHTHAPRIPKNLGMQVKKVWDL